MQVTRYAGLPFHRQDLDLPLKKSISVYHSISLSAAPSLWEEETDRYV